METSFQIERLKSKKRERYCHSFVTNKRLCSSYFVLYEFKVGFIRSLIEFYLFLEITEDPSEAFAEWSDKFEIREQKNAIVLMAIMHRVYKTISTKDAIDYLGKLESVIRMTLDGFFSNVSNLVGQFAEDEIVKYEIKDRKDFASFYKICEIRSCISQSIFWKQNKHNLKKLINDEKLSRLKKHERLYNYLVKIEDNIMNSEEKYTNKAVGDAVIAIECPKSIILITFDQSYDYLCPPLNKIHERIAKSPRVKAELVKNLIRV